MKKSFKKIISVVLAGVMAMPVILAMPFSAQAENNDIEYFNQHLIARYFTDSNLTEDKVGDNDLETVGTGATWNTSGLYNTAKFPGGSSGSKTNYYRVRLTDMFSGVTASKGVTVSFIAQRGGNDYQRYFEFSTNSGYGNGDKTSYLYFSCNSNAKVKSQPYGNSESSSAQISDDGAWHQWTITLNKSCLIVYCDGVFSGRVEDTSRITDAFFNVIKDGYLLLGASSYESDPLFSGSITDFKIYDVALNSVQVKKEATSRPTNHNLVNVRYKTAVNFNGTEGSDYAIEENYYYSPEASKYGLVRYSTAQNIYTDDNYKYFSMWNFNDKLTYYDNADNEAGIFQNLSDFRFDVNLSSRRDSASEYLIGIFDKNNNFPIKLLKNGNISINSTEITGINAVYSDDNEKYLNNYTFSFDYSKQILHFSCYGEVTDSSHNFAIERDFELADYGLTLNPSDLSGINILDGSGDGHVRFGGIYFYVPYAHVDPNLEGLKDAVKMYEAKMKNGRVYANALQAYNAYVLANRYIDAAEYGNRVFTEAEYDSIASTLETATNNMKVWTPKQATYHATFDGDNDYVSDEDYAKTYVNVLWANDVSTSQSDAAVYEGEVAIYQSSEKVNPRLYHPSAVLLYDGINTPAIPVMSFFRHWTSSFHTFNIYYSAMFLNSDTDSLEIDSRWRNGSGSDESFNYQWNYLNNKTVDIAGYETFDIAQHWGKYFTSSYEFSFGYANQIRFIGEMGDTEYKRTLNSVNWGFNFYNQTSNKKEVRANSNKPIYVVNYKALIDALDRAASKTASIENYKEGGMSDFFAIYEQATAFDPQTAFDYSNDAATTADICAQEIKNMVESLDSATYGREDSYQQLRDEMKTNAVLPTGNTCEEDYNKTIAELNQTYTYNSISAFRRAYKDAIREMYLLVENDYSSYPATLDDLISTHTSLEELADYSNLDLAKEKALEDAAAIDESLYTPSSVEAFNEYITSQFEFPYEYLGDRTNTGVSEQANIDAEALKFASAQEDVLKRRTALSYFDETYRQATEMLEGMAIAAPQYMASDVEALITLINREDIQHFANQSADDRIEFEEGGAEDIESTQLADEIKAQMDSMTAYEGAIDISAYQQAVFVAIDRENDAYDYPEANLNSDLNIVTNKITTTIEYNGLTLKVIKNDATQTRINTVTTLILSQLTAHIRQYTIEIAEGEISATSGITFNGGTHTYDSDTGTYKVTYNTKLNLRADSYSAWYMEFDSPSVSRGIQYQACGNKYSTKVIGNIKVYVYNSEDNYQVTVTRKYSDSDIQPVNLVMFTKGAYILPSAPAIAFYTFSGYTVGDESYNPGDEIEITGDTLVLANYTLNESLGCAVNIDGEEGRSASYNDKIILEGNDDTYAWLELDKKTNRYKPFYIGKDLTFFVTESITLKKVSQEEFEAGKYKLPAINIRQDGTYVTEADNVKKVYFNGQFVTDGSVEIAEYGILMGKAKSGGSITANDVLLENIGTSDEYSLTRFKSTKSVGANQFTIGVKNLSGDVIYKGYITYKLSNGGFVTAYTDAKIETL